MYSSLSCSIFVDLLFVVAPTIGSVFDSLLILTPIVGFCNCSMFCCALLYNHSSFSTILMVRESWFLCLVCLLGACDCLTGPWIGLQFVIVVFSYHPHLLFLVLVLLVCTVRPFKFCNLFEWKKGDDCLTLISIHMSCES